MLRAEVLFKCITTTTTTTTTTSELFRSNSQRHAKEAHRMGGSRHSRRYHRDRCECRRRAHPCVSAQTWFPPRALSFDPSDSPAHVQTKPCQLKQTSGY